MNTVVKIYVSIIILSLSHSNLKAQVTPPAAYPGGIELNYVRTWEAITPQDNPDSMRTAQLGKSKQVTAYFDGLGRPIQTVGMKTTFRQGDIITPQAYDEYGREAFTYLPYAIKLASNGEFKTDPFNIQANYYKAVFVDSFSYAYTRFERSPLSRPIAMYAPGQNWVGASRAVTSGYFFSTVSDSVRIWTVSSGVPNTTGRYVAGQLQKNVTTDEHGKQVIEYKDAEGMVVLKKVQIADSPAGAHSGWLCTYYVYNDLNELMFVLQPKAVEQLLGNNWAFSGNTLNELCFKYNYDERHRMTIKKVPGAGEVHMVYDARDRLVMTQDSVQRANGEWMVMQYDAINRPVRTYLWSNSSSGATHQASAQTSIAYPSLSGTYTLLTETYYDHYNWMNGTGISAFNSSDINSTYFITSYGTGFLYAQPLDTTGRTRGMVTGTKIRVMNAQSGMPAYLYSANWYDEKGRVLQVQSTNTSGYVDCTTTQYDYSGKPLRILNKHKKAAGTANTFYVLTKYEYDHGGRLITTKKMVNDSTSSNSERTIAVNTYTDFDQLQMKYLGGDATTALDSLEYDYNMRGWMTYINKDYLDSLRTNWFGMELAYDKGSLLGYTGNQYNGNIAGTKWRSRGDGIHRKYDFAYDNANRLISANWQNDAPSFIPYIDKTKFSSEYSYDANGNILSLMHYGWKVSDNMQVDRLGYTYQSNSNKLLAVTDTTSTATKLGDFTDGTNGGSDYSYDGNGNLVADSNKHISAILYNHMNLPQSITVDGKGTIDYVYDAAGSKLMKKTVEGAKTTRTQYTNGFVYQNDTLQFLGHEEGRVRWAKRYWLNGDSVYQFVYDYFIKDHLGNVRLVLTEQKDTSNYMATFEAAGRAKEEALFYNIAETCFPVWANYPDDYTTTPNDSTSKVAGTSRPIGVTHGLKVMSGDRMEIGVKSYFKGWTTDDHSNVDNNAVYNLLNSLIDGIEGAAGTKINPGELGTAFSTPLFTTIDNFLDNQDYDTMAPKAYLNWILLDEQFNYVPSGSGFIQVANEGELNTMAQNITIAKNGYFFTFVSNVSNTIDVYFDNLVVNHFTGPLLEETHYYPFGLTMHGISSKAADKLENYYKFIGKEQQSKEFSDGVGLDMYDFGARFYDAQIGRFGQTDPKSGKYFAQSTYNYVGNNPISRFDPNGMEWDEKAKKQVDGINKKIDSKITEIDKAIASVSKSDKDINGNSTYNADEQKKVDEYKARRGDLTTAKEEIVKMGNDKDHVFSLNAKSGIGSGYTQADPKDLKNINITYIKGDFGNQLHEMKHGFQITDKLMTPNADGTFSVPTLDIGRELEVQAYQRQISYSGSIPFSLMPQSGNDPYSALNGLGLLGTEKQINTPFKAIQLSDITKDLIPRIMKSPIGMERLYPEY